MTNDDLSVIENFINKRNPTIEFYEMQAIVKMQYELYKRLMIPTYTIKGETDDSH